MRHKKDHAEPPIRAIVLALTAVILVTLVVQSLVSHRGVPAALTRYARSDHAQNAANRVPAHLPASAAWHVAPAAPPIQKRARDCAPVYHTGQLTVVSYNIHSALGDGGLQLARVAQSIQLWNADVVLLQEVDVNRAWTRHINMPEWLASTLGGWHYAFGANVARGHGSLYGTAILSRYPILEQTNTHLPNRPGMQQRGLLHAIIAPHGREISLYDTHLQNKSESMRIAQIHALDPIVGADSRPTVLGGDFNSTPNSPVMAIARQVLADTWTDVGAGAGFTHPSWHLQGRIDYLLHRGAIQPVSADVVNGGFSDHMAVRALYDYRYRHGQTCHFVN